MPKQAITNPVLDGDESLRKVSHQPFQGRDEVARMHPLLLLPSRSIGIADQMTSEHFEPVGAQRSKV